MAADIRAELKERITRMERIPGLAIILVGGRQDSAIYVKLKRKACAEIGINSFDIDYPAEVTQDELLEKSMYLSIAVTMLLIMCRITVHFTVDELNMNPDVHGILVQLPLPDHINEQTVIERVLVDKDVDGLHPLNIARLASTKAQSASRGDWSFDSIHYHVPCAAQGKIPVPPRLSRPTLFRGNSCLKNDVQMM